jgi:REP-associated tyrosine transposase
MGRRHAPGGYVYHVLNRINEKTAIFGETADYAALMTVLEEALEKFPMRLISYCFMPNHWHFVLWPRADGDLGQFMHWLTMTHSKRWRRHSESEGAGHLYRGRYKSIVVEADDHYYTLCRYVERNALRAGLVDLAESWPWSSLGVRQTGCRKERLLLTEGPLPFPDEWASEVNRPETQGEFDDLRVAIRRGRPFGSTEWTLRVAKELGIESTLRPRGRPRKKQTV